MKSELQKKVNYDAVDTSSKKLKVSGKSSTRSTSDSSIESDLGVTDEVLWCPESFVSVQSQYTLLLLEEVC